MDRDLVNGPELTCYISDETVRREIGYIMAIPDKKK